MGRHPDLQPRVVTFTYGYFEFRACFPAVGRGMWPALWFFAAFDSNGDERRMAEIDLVEIFGPASGTPWFMSLHELQWGGTPAPGSNGSVNGFYQGRHDTTRWHTYGLDWQEDALTFYVDREPVARKKGARRPVLPWGEDGHPAQLHHDRATGPDRPRDPRTPRPPTR